MIVRHGETVESVVERELRRLADAYGGKIERDGNLVVFDGFAVAWKWRSSDPHTVLFFAVWPAEMKGPERVTAGLAYMDGKSVVEGWPQ